MKVLDFFVRFLFFVLLFLIVGYTITAQNSISKRLYLSISDSGQKIPSYMNESLPDKMKIYVLDYTGSKYSIISENDLEFLFKQTVELQKQGKEPEELIEQIGRAMNADEILNGKVVMERGRYKLFINHLIRNSTTGELKTGGVVELGFDETEFDSAVELAVKKLFVNEKLAVRKSSNKAITSVVASNTSASNSSLLLNIAGLNWGVFEGQMKWDEAVEHCTQRGMRLPTRGELKRMSKLRNGLLNEPCCVYWTSSESEKDDDYAYYIDINDGFSGLYHKDIDVRVRCVKE